MLCIIGATSSFSIACNMVADWHQWCRSVGRHWWDYEVAHCVYNQRVLPWNCRTRRGCPSCRKRDQLWRSHCCFWLAWCSSTLFWGCGCSRLKQVRNTQYRERGSRRSLWSGTIKEEEASQAILLTLSHCYLKHLNEPLRRTIWRRAIGWHPHMIGPVELAEAGKFFRDKFRLVVGDSCCWLSEASGLSPV